MIVKKMTVFQRIENWSHQENNANQFINWWWTAFLKSFKKKNLMKLHYERRFSEAPIRKIEHSVKKLAFSQTTLVATLNNISNTLTNNLWKMIIQIIITQKTDVKLCLKFFFSIYYNTTYAKIKKQIWFYYYINWQ